MSELENKISEKEIVKWRGKPNKKVYVLKSIFNLKMLSIIKEDFFLNFSHFLKLYIQTFSQDVILFSKLSEAAKGEDNALMTSLYNHYRKNEYSSQD